MAPLKESPQPFTDFKTAYCEHFGCAPEAFLDHLLPRSCDLVWRPVVCVLRRAKPDVFVPDLRYLQRVGQAKSWSEVVFLANGIPSNGALTRGWLRQGLHLRISGARLTKIGQQIAQSRQESL